MCYEGKIHNGMVILDDGPVLPDGTRVTVTLVQNNGSSPDDDAEADRLSEAMLKLAGTVKGLPADFARNHDHYLHGQPKK